MSSFTISRREFAVLCTAVSSQLKKMWPLNGSAARGPVTATHAAGGDAHPGMNAFPGSDYTPFGYLNNPAHSAVINRSGIVRSVPPLGFGWWARRMPWPYGEGALRQVNYLSFLHLSFVIDGQVKLHSTDDFSTRKIALVSRYHTGNLFSYDWTYEDLSVTIQYCLATPNALLANIEMRNSGTQPRAVTIHATNIYGFPEDPWWGSDGITSTFAPDRQIALSKIWAYGDIFALAADRKSDARKATTNEDTWNTWIGDNDLSNNEGDSGRFPGAIHTVQSYQIQLRPGRQDRLTICLARGENQEVAATEFHSAINAAPASIRRKLDQDDRFYRSAPQLVGDWPEEWIHGWIYDLETLRMTMRPPLGIYKHPWDGMQIFTPRAVLGETMLDTMALSYADCSLAKEVILGMFADAPAPNLPCSREDGSVNMICADGSEVGTAPTWGVPYHVIRSIYVRDADAGWITALYPHMVRYLNWWLANRTDKNGWFHCKCSWESGQDASKRFLVAAENPGAVADFVRTVDVEAAMANAFSNMTLFCRVAGRPQDEARWRELAQRRIETTRTMFVDGWFRDFDSRNNQPIILKDYYDIMMLYPLSLGIATEEQSKALIPWLNYFAEHSEFWLEWPSFMFPFSEAAWNAGQRKFIGNIAAQTAARVYKRTDAKQTKTISPFESTMPERFQYRIPGIANEFWPIKDDNPGGCENYGWGATLPTILIRNLIGFREFDDPAKSGFRIAPALPDHFLNSKATYGMTNLHFGTTATDVEYRVTEDSRLNIRLSIRGAVKQVSVRDESGSLRASSSGASGRATIEFNGVNGELYSVTLTS
jgi:hypothetical protein